jgi:uncharacterized tellurite resistance protein B-like protein
VLDRIRRFFDQHIVAELRDAPAPRLGKGAGGDPDHALHLATAALLLEVSRADFRVHDKELAAIAGILQRQFEFGDDETRELLEVARSESDDLLSLHPFVRLINEHFDGKGRARIIEDLWHVAYADGKLDRYQEYTVRKIADLLYVPHSVYIRAKLKAEEGVGDRMQEAGDN